MHVINLIVSSCDLVIFNLNVITGPLVKMTGFSLEMYTGLSFVICYTHNVGEKSSVFSISQKL